MLVDSPPEAFTGATRPSEPEITAAVARLRGRLAGAAGTSVARATRPPRRPLREAECAPSECARPPYACHAAGRTTSRRPACSDGPRAAAKTTSSTRAPHERHPDVAVGRRPEPQRAHGVDHGRERVRVRRTARRPSGIDSAGHEGRRRERQREDRREADRVRRLRRRREQADEREDPRERVAEQQQQEDPEQDLARRSCPGS